MADTPANPVANQVVDECDSTNEVAKRLGADGAPHGTWISALRQTAGRGRQGRSWDSERGNLFLSIVARPAREVTLTWIPLAVAVGVKRALLALAPELPLRIKWPNDLWVNEKKIGGILCEGVGNRGGNFLVIGLGLNCAHAPEGLDQPTTSLARELSAPPALEAVREACHREILRAVDDLSASAPVIAAEYATASVFAPGTTVEWGAEDGNQGTVVGLGAFGELKVRRADGSEQPLYAEDVRKLRKK